MLQTSKVSQSSHLREEEIQVSRHGSHKSSPPNAELVSFIKSSRQFQQSLMQKRVCVESYNVDKWNNEDWNNFLRNHLHLKDQDCNPFKQILDEKTHFAFQNYCDVLKMKINDMFFDFNTFGKEREVGMLYLPCFIFAEHKVVLIPLIKVYGKKLQNGIREVRFLSCDGKIYPTLEEFLEYGVDKLPHCCLCLPARGKYSVKKNGTLDKLPLEFLNINPNKALKKDLYKKIFLEITMHLLTIPCQTYFFSGYGLKVAGMKIIAFAIDKYIEIYKSQKMYNELVPIIAHDNGKGGNILYNLIKGKDFVLIFLEFAAFIFYFNDCRNTPEMKKIVGLKYKLATFKDVSNFNKIIRKFLEQYFVADHIKDTMIKSILLLIRYILDFKNLKAKGLGNYQNSKNSYLELLYSYEDEMCAISISNLKTDESVPEILKKKLFESQSDLQFYEILDKIIFIQKDNIINLYLENVKIDIHLKENI